VARDLAVEGVAAGRGVERGLPDGADRDGDVDPAASMVKVCQNRSLLRTATVTRPLPAASEVGSNATPLLTTWSDPAAISGGFTGAIPQVRANPAATIPTRITPVPAAVPCPAAGSSRRDQEASTPTSPASENALIEAGMASASSPTRKLALVLAAGNIQIRLLTKIAPSSSSPGRASRSRTSSPAPASVATATASASMSPRVPCQVNTSTSATAATSTSRRHPASLGAAFVGRSSVVVKSASQGRREKQRALIVPSASRAGRFRGTRTAGRGTVSPIDPKEGHPHDPAEPAPGRRP